MGTSCDPYKTVAHEMCRLSPKCVSNVPRSTFTVPSPKRSATHVRRLYVSRNSILPCKRPQIRGSAQGRALPTLRQGRRMWRAPRSPKTRAYTACPDTELERCPRMDKCPCSQGWREGTVVGMELCVAQVP